MDDPTAYHIALKPYEQTGIAPVDAVKANKRAFKLSAYGRLLIAPSGRNAILMP